MPNTAQAFTQSLRLIDPINQQRIRQQKRVLWPDYEVLTLINSFEEAAQRQETALDLSNLFMYCAIEEKFVVRNTNKKDYLNLSECYDHDFTHMAVYMCKKNHQNNERNSSVSFKHQNSRSLDNRRKSSVERIYKPTKINSQQQQIYVILSRRAIAIDEVIKTNHKVCISVVPLSSQKHLWGGMLNYQEFQPLSQNKSSQGESGLFKSGGQTFGFNIASKPANLSGSIRKTNGTIDNRQLRFSNYHSSKKEHQKQHKQKESTTTKQPKDCTNTIKFTPQHIRQHQQYLYIEIDLTTLTQLPQRQDEYNFMTIDIFGRHMKPKYGGKYEDQSSQESQDDQIGANSHKKLRKLMKEEIFLVYSMPFMVLNSYLESQLNFEDNQDMREISFRGSCSMFSAMKKLQLKSSGKQQEQKEKVDNKQGDDEKSLSRAKKQKVSYQERTQQNNEDDSSRSNRSIPKSSQLFVDSIKIKDKEEIGQKKILNNDGFEVIELGQSKEQQLQGQKKQNEKIGDTLNIEDIRSKIIKCLVLRIKETIQKQRQPSQDRLVYFPVFNSKSCEPNRISIPLPLLKMINYQIQNQTTNIQVEQYRLQDKSKQQQVEIDAIPIKAKRYSRQSIYLGKNSKTQPQINPNSINYVQIDVFLTDKVYKQQSVQKLVDLLEVVEKLSCVSKQQIDGQNGQWLNQLDNVLMIRSVDEMKNMLQLMNDIEPTINGTRYEVNNSVGSMIRLLIWVETLCVMSEMSEIQLELIKIVKEQTQHLIESSSSVNNKIYQVKHQHNNKPIITQDELKQKQLNVQQLIKNYHQKSTIQQQQSGQFLIQLFFFFFSQQLNACGWVFGALEKVCDAVKHQSNEFLNVMRVVEEVFGKFLLMNCNHLLGEYNQNLQNLIEKLEQSCEKQQDERQGQKDVDIDQNPQLSVTVTNTLTNQYHTQNQNNNNKLPLIKLLKSSLTYTLQHITQIPINIFLSHPLQSFQDYFIYRYLTQRKQYLEQNHSSKHPPQKLKRFIQKYFVRGHNSFQSQNVEGINDFGSDLKLMNLVTDLLQLYIRIVSIEKIAQSGGKEDKKITNIIQLINHEYQDCMAINSTLIFSKINRSNKDPSLSNKESLLSFEQIASFNKLNQNHQTLNNKKKISKFNQLNSNPQYTSINISFLINPEQSNQTSINKLQTAKSIFSTKNLFTKTKPKSITLQNTKSSFPLSTSKQSLERYDFVLTISQKDNLNEKSLHLNEKSLQSFHDLQILFYPNKFISKNSHQASINDSYEISFNDSYEISFLNSQLGLKDKFNNKSVRKILFNCYEVLVKVELLIRNDIKSRKQSKEDFQTITVHGASVLVFDNFKTSSISTNIITLSTFDKEQQNLLKTIKLSNIHKANIQIHSRQLPILQHSLSFINLRLNKYLKSLLPQNTLISKQKSSRKTIGGRFTQHLSKRNDILEIEENMGVGNKKHKQGRNHQLNNSTLYDLPQQLIYHLLNADKCYVQEEEKLLKFVDEFYQRNQPIYQDYILYLAIRPNFLRLSTVLKHFFTNRTKYQDSQILNSFIKLKMSSPFSSQQLSKITKIFTFMPRISSLKPLKNAKDTLQQRDLLVNYAKQSSKRQSLEKGQLINLFNGNGNSLFGKKSKVPQIKEQKREEEKDIEI